jgi:hypothetical protein
LDLYLMVLLLCWSVIGRWSSPAIGTCGVSKLGF